MSVYIENVDVNGRGEYSPSDDYHDDPSMCEISINYDFTLSLGDRYNGYDHHGSESCYAEFPAPKLSGVTVSKFAYDVAAWAYDEGFKAGVEATKSLVKTAIG